MKPITRAARRGLAALALAGAAVAVPTAALAASGSPAKPGLTTRAASAAALPRCGTGSLTAWLGIPGNGSAGSVSATSWSCPTPPATRARCTASRTLAPAGR